MQSPSATPPPLPASDSELFKHPTPPTKLISTTTALRDVISPAFTQQIVSVSPSTQSRTSANVALAVAVDGFYSAQPSKDDGSTMDGTEVLESRIVFRTPVETHQPMPPRRTAHTHDKALPTPVSQSTPNPYITSEKANEIRKWAASVPREMCIMDDALDMEREPGKLNTAARKGSSAWDKI
ncbi:hypothetical protein B0H11DRAFT_1918344 [Mycena galericulata]|nr:hypothetical protein B0H11DRAFT_1918344 [Mycena galericulata]